MKRLGILLIFFLSNIFNVYSQTSDASKIARTAFQHGDYAEAVNWYKSAINLTDNPDEKATLNQSLSKAQSCAANLSQADSFFSKGDYASARSSYQRLLAANPSDPNASRRIAQCDQKISDASNRHKRDEAYRTALRSGDDASIRAFMQAYPDDERNSLLTLILCNGEEITEYIGNQVTANHPEQLSEEEFVKEFDNLFSRHCLSVGDAFASAGNTNNARIYYNIAASYGDAYALYKQALCYEDLSQLRPRSLLAIAAAGNSHLARDKLARVLYDNPTLKYDKDAARRLFDNLQRCRSDFKSALYVYMNAELYDMNKESAAIYFPNNEDEIIESQRKALHGDQILYQYGMVFAEQGHDPKKLMYASAERGNIAAIKWVVDHTGDADFRLCQKLSQSNIADIRYKSYIKYLQGRPLNPSEWFDMYLMRFVVPLNPNEELLSLVKSNTFTDTKFYQNLEEVLAKEAFWDSDIIKELLTFNYTLDSKRLPKIKKRLSKVSTLPGLYRKEEAAAYRLAMLGTYDNLHGLLRQINVETLWTGPSAAGAQSASTTASTSSRTTTPASTSASGTSSYSGTTVVAPTAVRYEIGQDVGDGYVYYVDSSGQHGWKVSKTVYNISPKTAYKFKPDAGWSIPKANDLYWIYKIGRFAVGNYFFKDGPNVNNYGMVVFNKKHAYNSKLSWDHTYSLLLVKSF